MALGSQLPLIVRHVGERDNIKYSSAGIIISLECLKDNLRVRFFARWEAGRVGVLASSTWVLDRYLTPLRDDRLLDQASSAERPSGL